MLTSLYSRLAQVLPTSVKRFLKSMMLVHASPSETLPATHAPPASQGSLPATRQSRVRAERAERGRNRAARQRDRARLQRDEARRELGEARRKLTRLQRETAQPADQWWEQRLLLAGRDHGIGLRDFAYFPGGAQNPYLRLVYSRLPEVGFDPRPLGRLDHLYRLGADSVFHLHWTRVAQLGARTIEEAEEKTAEFLDPIEDFVQRGGTFLWSIHEPLPHDCPFPAVERRLRTRLGELATGIHVLHEATLDEIGGAYEVPSEKIFVVEHPLYTGAYEQIHTRAAARRLLGISDDEIVLLCLGAIRPYKGFDRLVEMIPDLEADSGQPVRVMIAGPTMGGIDLTDLQTLVDKSKGATMSAESVPDASLHVLLEAGDVMALPYRAVLNSGVLMLGITFGKLCVAPRNPVTTEAAASGLVELFETTDDTDLLRATRQAIERSRRPHGVAPEFEARYRPEAIAGLLAEAVTRIAGDQT